MQEGGWSRVSEYGARSRGGERKKRKSEAGRRRRRRRSEGEAGRTRGRNGRRLSDWGCTSHTAHRTATWETTRRNKRPPALPPLLSRCMDPMQPPLQPSIATLNTHCCSAHQQLGRGLVSCVRQRQFVSTTRSVIARQDVAIRKYL